jgi:hypothetical protein
VSESYIPLELRRIVLARAKGRCEYCGIAEADTYFGCEVDHIISEKHRGATEESNLALACVTCNRAKGSDVATVGEDDALIELYHPRRHTWSDHFSVVKNEIVGRTAIGKGTVRLLKLNAPERVAERALVRRRVDS